MDIPVLFFLTFICLVMATDINITIDATSKSIQFILWGMIEQKKNIKTHLFFEIIKNRKNSNLKEMKNMVRLISQIYYFLRHFIIFSSF